MLLSFLLSFGEEDEVSVNRYKTKIHNRNMDIRIRTGTGMRNMDIRMGMRMRMDMRNMDMRMGIRIRMDEEHGYKDENGDKD